LRCREESRDLGGGEEVGLGPSCSWQETGLWHLGLGGRGLEVAEKPPRHTQAPSGAARPPVRGGLAGPLQRHLSSDGTTGLLSLDKGDELGKEHLFGMHVESEGFAQTQVRQKLGLDKVGIYSAPPPHGSATAANASRSNLA
jgi:hypothetical protein